MRACHTAGPGSIPVGTNFLGEDFSGFSSPVRQMSGRFRSTRFPNIIWPSKSSIHIRLVRMNGCVNGAYRLSCSSYLGGGPGIQQIPHHGRFSMSLCGSTPMVPWLSYSPLDPRFADSNPAEVDGFFSKCKNPKYDFLRKGSKAVGPVS